MEKLGSSIEDSLFGRAGVFSGYREDGILVREIQSQLRAELSEAVRILGESGCNSFLDVARVLVMIGVWLIRINQCFKLCKGIRKKASRLEPRKRILSWLPHSNTRYIIKVLVVRCQSF